MIIKVEKTREKLKNQFKIKVNGELKYLACTPGTDIEISSDIDKMKKCVITKKDETVCYVTHYSGIENFSNTAIPMKWAFTGEQKSHIFEILDDKNNNCGKFYKLTNGFLDTKYVIEYGNYTLKNYDISVGKTRNISIYKDDFQIAEILQPLRVRGTSDYYYLFLLDEYSELETILSFFTVFFDYQNYSNTGMFSSYDEEAKTGYTYDKNNKFYDKNWIANNFNKDEVNLINNQMAEERKEINNRLNKEAKYISLFIALGCLIVFIVFGILYYIYYG